MLKYRLDPTDIKIEEAAKIYQLNRGSRKEETMIDQDMGVKHWLHPAVKITILRDNNEDNSTTQIFNEGSKSEQGVGAGIAVYRSGTHTKSLKYRLNKRCTNNQAEQLAILKSLEYTETTDNRQVGHHIHRQPNDSGLAPKQQYTHIPHKQNKTKKQRSWNRPNGKSISAGSRHKSGS
jgi:ribonuclease HI